MNPTTQTIQDRKKTTPNKALATNDNANYTAKMKSICEDFQCKEKVGDILQQMDHSVDSCEDFYQFACGRSTRKNVLSAKMKLLRKTLDNPSNNLQAEHFRRFVKSCVQYQYGFEYAHQEKIEQSRRSSKFPKQLNNT